MADEDLNQLNAVRAALEAQDESLKLSKVREYFERQLGAEESEIEGNKSDLTGLERDYDSNSGMINQDEFKYQGHSSESIAQPFLKDNENISIGTYSSQTGNSDVFNRLYSQMKPISYGNVIPNPSGFKPKIDSKSRKIATSQGERRSLYERALQQRYRQETSRDLREREERENRNKSKLSESSKELAWKRLKREIEEVFTVYSGLDSSSSISNGNSDNSINEDGKEEDNKIHKQVTQKLNREQFSEAMVTLGFGEIIDDLYVTLSGDDDGLVSCADFCIYVKRISYPSTMEDEEFAANDSLAIQFKRLLIGRKAIPSHSSMQRVLQEVAEQTPFNPQITERSRQLDLQRKAKLGIDPNLPRTAKIQAEVKALAERKESTRMHYVKKELAECTFKPKTTQFVPHSASSSSSPMLNLARNNTLDVGSRLHKESIERRNRLATRANEQMNNELSSLAAECTFRPKTNTEKRKVLMDRSTLSSNSIDTPSAVRAFNSSVDRLKAWRLKHVVEQDTADLKYIATHGPSQSKKQSSFSTPKYARELRKVIFSAEVNLPNGQTDVLELRKGDSIHRCVHLFARKHGLDERAESTLAMSLSKELNLPNQLEHAIESPIPMKNSPDSHSIASSNNNNNNNEDDDNYLLIDIIVRPGETYTLRIGMDDDPSRIAYEFAKEVGMDDEARDRLIESLSNLPVS